MDIRKASPDAIAAYVDFLIAFTIRPAATMSQYLNPEEDTAPGVSGKLVLYAVFGATLAYAIVEIGAAIGMAEDSSQIVQFASRLDRLVAPVATVFLIVVAGVMLHIAFKVVGFVGVFLGQEAFRGSILGSINASLGFSAWAIPLLTIVIVGLRIAAANDYSPNPVAIFLIVMPPALAFWFYFVAAVAGAHGIPRGQAASLFALTVVVLALAGDLFD